MRAAGRHAPAAMRAAHTPARGANAMCAPHVDVRAPQACVCVARMFMRAHLATSLLLLQRSNACVEVERLRARGRLLVQLALVRLQPLAHLVHARALHAHGHAECALGCGVSRSTHTYARFLPLM